MTIGDLITIDRVHISSDIQSKKRALEQLSRMLASGTELGEAPVFSSLINREKLGSTGLGDGVAIPHGRLAGLNNSVGAFLQLTRGVDYEASDNVPVDLIFGLLVPEDTNEAHLKILATLAEMFTDDEFCARLRGARQEADLLQLLANYSPEPAK